MEELKLKEYKNLFSPHPLTLSPFRRWGIPSPTGEG